MNPSEVIAVLEEKGAVLRGHFRLSSGRHSDVFVQKFRVLEHPGLTERFGEEIARAFDGAFDLVASPAVGAVVLGFATALSAGTKMIFAERVSAQMVFRRGFEVPAHSKTLVVEDVVTTGGSALEVVRLVEAAGGEVVGVGALLDRTDPAVPTGLGAAFRALARLDAPAWDPTACPLCSEGMPLDDPGSRRIS